MKPLSETYKEQGIAFTFPIEIEDAHGNHTYYEDSDGVWHKAEYNSNGNQTYFESSDGHKRGRKANGNDYWSKRGRDANGNQTYYENSDGLGQVGA